jgi:site-specific recombinase XerD
VKPHASISAISNTFTGKLTLSNIVAPRSSFIVKNYYSRSTPARSKKAAYFTRPASHERIFVAYENVYSQKKRRERAVSEGGERSGEMVVVEGPACVEGRDPGALVVSERLPRDGHPVLVYLAALAPGSRRTMRGSLESIARFVSGGEAGAEELAWHRLRYQHTAAIRSALSGAYSPATANKMLSALRGVLKECFRLGYIDAETYARASDIPSVRGSRAQRGRALSREELGELFGVCAGDEKVCRGARDAALLAVLYGSGLRRSEIVALDLSDYDRESGTLTVRSGKGNKGRISYAAGGADTAIEGWVRYRGEDDGPLFRPINKAGRVERRRMSDQAVLYILQRRAREAGLRSFSPHDLRRTFIGDLLDAGADIATVRHMAGHANVQTTARYDRRGEVAKRRAAALLRVPRED